MPFMFRQTSTSVPAAFGVLLFARPDVGAITLALLFGLFSLIYGITRITFGVQLHQQSSQHGPGGHHPRCGQRPEDRSGRARQLFAMGARP